MSRHDTPTDPAPIGRNGSDPALQARQRRLRGFRTHLIGYFAVMTVLVPVNLLTTPDNPWSVWPMVGWGSILALHTAWAMGLFDILSGDR